MRTILQFSCLALLVGCVPTANINKQETSGLVFIKSGQSPVLPTLTPIRGILTVNRHKCVTLDAGGQNYLIYWPPDVFFDPKSQVFSTAVGVKFRAGSTLLLQGYAVAKSKVARVGNTFIPQICQEMPAWLVSSNGVSIS